MLSFPRYALDAATLPLCEKVILSSLFAMAIWKNLACNPEFLRCCWIALELIIGHNKSRTRHLYQGLP